uniref:Uncharacterized protein n=1 Tax=Oryza sativa subsp. japonica TaxID=39947 RepID=Q5VRZ7_ORYSJ|nr:hypothetical protein [Oryza sativa Japonica Group]
MAPAPAVAAAPPPAKLIAWHTERLLPTHGAGGARGRDPQLRPSMAMVVGMLEGTMEVWEPWVQSLGFLRLYGRRVGVVAGGGADAVAHVLAAVLAAMHKLEENHPEAVNVGAVLAAAAPVAAASARCVGVGERVRRGLHRASADATRVRAAAPQAACRLSAASPPLCAARRRSPFSGGREGDREKRKERG